ncbi:hypothetical protein STSP2_02225 [Anaerohalosphaera lusitana]|uniref:Uncharacterized protein n=1 Tax=Anaerohalosphaera lusitana TaxID=1936003 RepID=A0A1U9NM69_9BACT|nr:HYExAFE family protein [Anaerohalosphaera lusitana]AQT69042.1 hypothetical protein STSP2_02225 [Anaerohalosphaera lusitana]
MSSQSNDYEIALESWLIENRLKYVAVDQQKRNHFARNSVKSFDFLLYNNRAGLCPDAADMIVAEVKGRLYKGTNFASLSGLQNWVTQDDVIGLEDWQSVLQESSARQKVEAVFVFAYRFEKIDVETDGRATYDFCDNRYAFLAVKLDDYRKLMKVRSPKWKTFSVPAADFRQIAKPLGQFLL